MKQKIIALFLAGVMLLGLAACANPNENQKPSDSQDNVSTDAPDEGEAMVTMMGCPLNMTPNEEDVYPYMGVKMRLPDALLDAVLDNWVFMQSGEDTEYTDLGDGGSVPTDWRPTAENTITHSGYLEFLYLPEEIRERVPSRDMEDPMTYDEFLEWIGEAVPMARLELYLKTEFQENMLEGTEYSSHEKLGENSKYVYYLSTNTAPEGATPEELALFNALDELGQGITFIEPREMDDRYFGIATAEVESISGIGTFETKTLTGETIDQSVFSNAKVTMVNVWTTWCGPCVAEMPDLAALAKELEGSGAQIISIVADTYDAKKGEDQEAIELAKTIIERTGVNFPTLIPDSNLADGLLKGVLGYPTTWFIDENGNVIGDLVLGSNSTEDWMKLIQERLDEVTK